MKIIKQRERVESVSYHRSFEYEDMPGAGFSFDCDEAGNVDVNKVPSASWGACAAGEIEVLRNAKYEWIGDELRHVPGTGRRVVVKLVDCGVREHRHSYSEPAVGECLCGAIGALIELSGFTNTCHRCGRDYNMSGQLLADRSQWGEETGETAADILAIDGADHGRCFLDE